MHGLQWDYSFPRSPHREVEHTSTVEDIHVQLSSLSAKKEVKGWNSAAGLSQVLNF
jgi:hypothetical protein